MTLKETDLPLDYSEAESRLEDAKRAISKESEGAGASEEEAWVRALCMEQWLKISGAIHRRSRPPIGSPKRETARANEGDSELLRDLRKAFATLVSSLTANERVGTVTVKALAAQLSIAVGGTESDRAVIVDPEKPETHVVAVGRAAVHTAAIPGEVISIDDHKIVVRFEYDGEDEEREFYWSTMKILHGELRVGDLVEASTELFLRSTPQAQSGSDVVERIYATVAEAARTRPASPETRITREAQEAAEREAQQGGS